MRRQLAIVISLCAVAAASPARAELWRYFPVSGGAVAFDVHSILADVSLGATAINTVVYYATPQPSQAGPASFRAERLTFQCLGGLYRLDNAAIYDSNGILLARYPDSGWLRLDQSLGSVALFRRIVCTTDEPPVTGEATSLATVYETLPTIAAAAATDTASPAARLRD